MRIAAFDGGASGNPGASGSGFLIDGICIGFINNGIATNNFAELNALEQLLMMQELLIPDELLHVIGDSAYVINGATSWIYKWKSNNWTKSDGGKILNIEKWINIEDMIARCGDVIHEFEHVDGHGSNIYNNVVDELTWMARAFNFSRIVRLDSSGANYLRDLINYSRSHFAGYSNYFQALESYLNSINL